MAKLNATGTALMYSTLLGGNSQDNFRRFAADASGNVYVFGIATSEDFPTTPGALGACNGPSGATFVAKLNPLGSGLIYSGCVAGTSGGGVMGMVVDSGGTVYAAGNATFADFPTTPGAFQTTFAGSGPHAFVFKLNPAGSAFGYSTFIDGSGSSTVSNMGLDSSGNVYVMGTTTSPDFPITPEALQLVPRDRGGSFIAKLDPSGSRLGYAALGWGGLTWPSTPSATRMSSVGPPEAVFPLVNPIQAGFNSGGQCGGHYPACTNALIFKLNPAGSALVYSTYYGSGMCRATGVVVDNSGNAYVTGENPPFLMKLADAGNAPAFSRQSVTNAASFQQGASIGEIVTLFGTNLTNVQGILTANSLPLPTQLGGTSILWGGVPAPIFAVANVNGKQQINFQVPPASAGFGVVVVNNGISSLSTYVETFSNATWAHPGIFTTDGSRGVIQHSLDSQPVTLANPAVRGEVLVLYATGLGPVQPDPGPGNPASSSPLSLTKGTTYVVVAGKLADVLFSGLAPGFVGLDQVNFRVPADVPSGDVDVFLQLQANNAAEASQKVKLAIQ